MLSPSSQRGDIINTVLYETDG